MRQNVYWLGNRSGTWRLGSSSSSAKGRRSPVFGQQHCRLTNSAETVKARSRCEWLWKYRAGSTCDTGASAAADFVCFGGCPPSGGCRVGRPVRCPRLRWAGCVPRQPHAPRQPRPRRLWAALPSPANSSDVPLMPLERQRCSIDAVCSGWRARGRGRGRGERGVRGMRCGTAGGANPACRGTSRCQLTDLRAATLSLMASRSAGP